MIQSKEDLFEYLDRDRMALGKKVVRPGLFMGDLIWKFERSLRYCEYYKNSKTSIVGKMFYYFWRYRKYRLEVKCGFTIPLNVAGKGLALVHRGTIIINSHAKIGENCWIHAGGNIGVSAGTDNAAPVIGNNVYIGPGAKIFGKIYIADGVAVGANAVVCKDVAQEDVTVVGVPARISSHKGSKGFINIG